MSPDGSSTHPTSRLLGTTKVLSGIITPATFLSFGGLTIFLAPILLPFLWISTLYSRGIGRAYFTLLGTIVAALSWGAASYAFDPARGWVLATMGAIITLAIFLGFQPTTEKPARIAAVALALALVGIFGLLGTSGEGTGASFRKSASSMEGSFVNMQSEHDDSIASSGGQLLTAPHQNPN